jgi:hypothetical protein
MAKAKTAKPLPKDDAGRVIVRATSKMDSQTFVLHFNSRHGDSLAGMTGLPPNIAEAVELSYRAFHRQLHRSRVDLDHVHNPSPPEDDVEYALRCLADNGARGWHEIAGTEGVAAFFPEERQIRVRIGGVISGTFSGDDRFRQAAILLVKGKAA